MPQPAIIRGPASPGPALFPWDTTYGLPIYRGTKYGVGPVQTTIRYVRKTGSDANGGTAPNDAWLTWNKALTTAPPGTIVYVGGGVYREVVTATIIPTAGSPVTLIGDVDGLFTGDVGMVQWTAYTTNDKTTPSGTTLLNLGGKSFFNFMNIFFVGGASSSIITATTTQSQSINFFDCAFIAGSDGNVTASAATVIGQYGMPLNWLFERCFFARGSSPTLQFALQNGVGSDYDANVTIRSCLFVAGAGTAIVSTLSGASGVGKGGGVRAYNNTQIGGGTFFSVANAACSINIPCVVRNNALLEIGNSGTALAATSSGQLIEDYNLIQAVTPRSNVVAGAHTIADGSYAPLFYFNQERIWGEALRPYGAPMTSSPLNAFGASDTLAGLLDARNSPRPSISSRWSVGAIQNGNNLRKETITINTGLNAISVTGDGFQDFDVEVDADPLTISVYCDYDGSYTGPLPRLAILANGEVGVGYTEINFSGTSSGAFASASITINPTASGFITVRVISGDTSGVSKVAFDTFAVA